MLSLKQMSMISCHFTEWQNGTTDVIKKEYFANWSAIAFYDQSLQLYIKWRSLLLILDWKKCQWFLNEKCSFVISLSKSEASISLYWWDKCAWIKDKRRVWSSMLWRSSWSKQKKMEHQKITKDDQRELIIITEKIKSRKKEPKK